MVFENYLLKVFKNHTADLGPVLVDTRSNYKSNSKVDLRKCSQQDKIIFSVEEFESK